MKITTLLVSFFALCSAALSLSAQSAGPKRIAAYYPNYKVYGGFYTRQLAVSGSAGKLGYLIYAFADIRADSQGNPTCATFDEFADYQYNFSSNISVDASNDSGAPGALGGQVHQLQELKKLYPNLKVMVSIGGYSAGVNGFEAAAATPESRRNFVSSCISSYIDGNFGNTTGLAVKYDASGGFSEQPLLAINPAPGIFDGFDIDWEFPTQPQDRKNFVALLREFRQQLEAKRQGTVLSAALPAGEQNFSFINLPGAAKQLDFINLETYDYAGPFNNETGFVAPLFRTEYDPSATFNVNFTVQSYLGAGVPPDKILMGFPFYAYGWAVDSGAPPNQNGLFVPATPQPNYAGTLAIQVNPNLKNIANTEEYNYLVTNVLPFSRIFRDPLTQEPWLFDGTNFWTYDDPRAIDTKLKYAIENQLGGASIFEITGDLFDGSLVHTIYRRLNTPLSY